MRLMRLLRPLVAQLAHWAQLTRCTKDRAHLRQLLEMSMAASEPRYVSLPTRTGGELVLPAEPVALTLQLQSRGFVLQADGDDLVVSPFSALSSEDCRLIRRWKAHILAVLAYEAPT